MLGLFMAIFDEAANTDAAARKSFVHKVEKKAKKMRVDWAAWPKCVRVRADSVKVMK